MAAETLTPEAFLPRARRTALLQQGLTRGLDFGKGPEGAAAAVKHLGYVQIDTLAVVERAHHHTIWTRVPDYKPEDLNRLTRDCRIFEYWFHAASFLPMEDYRFALPRMANVRRGKTRVPSADEKSMTHVLDRIRSEGPLKARDFESPRERKGSWWNWKPMKRALERLFMEGRLMIRDREGMTKIYDLTERVLPANTNTREPTLEEIADHLVEGALRANGFTTIKQVLHLRPGLQLRKAVENVLLEKIDAGLVSEYRVEGMPRSFARAGLMDGKLPAVGTGVRLLSPFDNAVIHRDRLEQFFDFDYRLECYVPGPKRKYGYFCLPILYGDTIIGRVDCKAHRNEKRLELIHLHVEKSIPDAEQFSLRLARAIKAFAKFNACNAVTLTKASPGKWTRVIRETL